MIETTSASSSNTPRPTVAILVSAYNEEEVIASKIQNFLQIVYPPSSLTLFIGLDGCSDRTAEEVGRFHDPRIRAVVNSERRGKTTVLNDLIAQTNADIVVFTDANVMFPPNTLTELLEPFQDPTIGLVSGRPEFTESTSHSQVRNIYNMALARLRSRESNNGGISGAAGPIYAMRRELIRELQPDLINDLAHPMEVALQGYRSTIAPKAIALEALEDDSLMVEYRRQVRMTAQAFHVVAVYLPQLVRHRLFRYSVSIILSKVLRWVLPSICAVALLVLTFMAVTNHSVILIAAVIAFWTGILLAIAGIFIRNTVLRIFTYLLLVSAAYTAGAYKWALGQKYVTWQPRSG